MRGVQCGRTIGGIAQSEPPSGPDSTYRDVIAYCFKTTFKNYATYELFEISEPRWVRLRLRDGIGSSASVLSIAVTGVIMRYFLTAVPFSMAIMPIRRTTVAVRAYVVFEQMGGLGLPPLH